MKCASSPSGQELLTTPTQPGPGLGDSSPDLGNHLLSDL